MISKKIPQVIVVSGETPEETAALFNAKMMELADLNIEPTFERDGNLFWIYYDITTTVCETKVEEYEQEHGHHNCSECPYCKRDLNRFGQPNQRKKHATCTNNHCRTRLDSSACEEYYKELERRDAKNGSSDERESQDRTSERKHDPGRTCKISGNFRSGTVVSDEKGACKKRAG